MKRILLIILFSGSLNSFSQVEIPDRFRATQLGDHKVTLEVTESTGTVNWRTPITPDTFRAIVLVTLSPNGIAHARMGFVVIEQGKEPVYLDCNKRALKLPMVGWGWRVVGEKEVVR